MRPVVVDGREGDKEDEVEEFVGEGKRGVWDVDVIRELVEIKYVMVSGRLELLEELLLVM